MPNSARWIGSSSARAYPCARPWRRFQADTASQASVKPAAPHVRRAAGSALSISTASTTPARIKSPVRMAFLFGGIAAVDQDRLAGHPPGIADQMADDRHEVFGVSQAGGRNTRELGRRLVI